MGLNAVQQYVKGIVDGTTSPFYDPAQAWIAPPIPGELTEQPQIFIWGARTHETRETMPRASSAAVQMALGGFKHSAYELDLFLMFADSPDDPNADSAFPCFVDAVKDGLRKTPIPVFITDSATGVKSQIIEVGEVFETDYAPVKNLAGSDERYVLQQALVIVHLTEGAQS